MFKRLFWLMVGAGFGFGVSFWLMRFVKQTAARYTPERVSSDLAGAVRAFGQDLKDAVAEGRAAMQEREAELRGEAEGHSATLRLVEPPAITVDPAPASAPTGRLARQLVERLSR
jgi:hypothetical protein